MAFPATTKVQRKIDEVEKGSIVDFTRAPSPEGILVTKAYLMDAVHL